MKHLKVFICIAMMQVPSQKWYKLDDKSKRCMFIDYCLQTKTYKLYNPCTHKFIFSRDVVFCEESLLDWRASPNTHIVYVWDDIFLSEQVLMNIC